MSTTRLYRYYRGKANSYHGENFNRYIANHKPSPIPKVNCYNLTAVSSLTTRGTVNTLSPPHRIMAATKSARSLSSSSRALNFTANSNFGSMISLKGLRRLRRNSLVTKPRPFATSSPSLFMSDGSMAKIASWTPYFNSVTCRSGGELVKWILEWSILT